MPSLPFSLLLHDDIDRASATDRGGPRVSRGRGRAQRGGQVAIVARPPNCLTHGVDFGV